MGERLTSDLDVLMAGCARKSVARVDLQIAIAVGALEGWDGDAVPLKTRLVIAVDDLLRMRDGDEVESDRADVVLGGFDERSRLSLMHLLGKRTGLRRDDGL